MNHHAHTVRVCVCAFASLFFWCIRIVFVGVEFSPAFFGLSDSCPFLFFTVSMTFTGRHFYAHSDCSVLTGENDDSAAPISPRPLRCIWLSLFTQTPPTRRHKNRQIKSRKTRDKGERNLPSAPKGRKADKRRAKQKVHCARLFFLWLLSFLSFCFPQYD